MLKEPQRKERERSPSKIAANAALRELIPRTRVLVLDAEPADEHVVALVETLEDAGYRVDTHVKAIGHDGHLPTEALRYDVVIQRPSIPDHTPRSAADLSDVQIGRLTIDVQRRMVLVDGQPVRMSAREFTLLHYLASRPGVVFSREAILRAVWGSTWRTEGSVTEYIRRVRMLLAPTGLADCIVTRKGFGYCFDPEAAQ